MTSSSQSTSASARLDKFEIHTWIDHGCPFEDKWRAALHEYDEGVHVATGRTQREAINELLDYYEQDNGEIC